MRHGTWGNDADAGGLQIQFSCGSPAVEMAMEMEMEKEMVQSYLVVPKKRWRTLLSMQSRNNKLPTVPTYHSTETVLSGFEQSRLER